MRFSPGDLASNLAEMSDIQEKKKQYEAELGKSLQRVVAGLDPRQRRPTARLARAGVPGGVLLQNRAARPLRESEVPGGFGVTRLFKVPEAFRIETEQPAGRRPEAPD